MPILTPEQVKTKLLHPAVEVRSAALQYFADAFSTDTTVLPVVIEALEKYGRDKAFQTTFHISKLAASAPVMNWAMNELAIQPNSPNEGKLYLSSITQIFCTADPELVRPHADLLLASSRIDQKYHTRLQRRLAYATRDGDALWAELQTICNETAKDPDLYGKERWYEAEDIAEALARQGERHAPRVLELLNQTFERVDENPMTWMEPLAVQMAGHMRLEAATTLLVAKLHLDVELLDEDCDEALTRIGTDDVIRACRADFPTASDHFQLWATGPLGGIHTDLAVEACIELLAQEEVPDYDGLLSISLVEHFSTEGNEAIRQYLLKFPDLVDLRDELIVACTIVGQEFPELEKWRKDAEKEKRKASERQARFERQRPSMWPLDVPPPSPPPPPSRPRPLPPPLQPPSEVPRSVQKAGRNDPCPCGSGKKFKKCCLKS